jgi:hypothetical protein
LITLELLEVPLDIRILVCVCVCVCVCVHLQDDFANAAMPDHYDTAAIAEGFRKSAIHFLLEHELSTKAHVGLGAVAALSFAHQLVYNTKSRFRHRIVSKIAQISSVALLAHNVYVLFVRPDGMVPVGSAAFWSNVIATTTLACALAVGLYAIFAKSEAPNYSLHRRAMIIAAGALFM